MRTLLILTTCLAFCVVVLGAYVRLSNAGLGCPDWPGCYGKMVVSDSGQANFPDQPLVAAKAWKEMAHRYAAGTLALLILAIFMLSFRSGRPSSFASAAADKHGVAPTLLLGVVIFQALLGMWTVTLKLHPLVVMGHLAGGLTTLGLLGWMTMDYLPHVGATHASPLRRWSRVALILLILQILLGGWTSANYAALACGNDFPTCQMKWWPPMDFRTAFTVWHEIGQNYEFGVLQGPARTAIHMAHRLGALVVFCVVGALGIACVRRRVGAQQAAPLRRWGILLLFLLLLQITLGISNAVFLLPLPVAVAHNAVAALLLLVLIAVVKGTEQPLHKSTPT